MCSSDLVITSLQDAEITNLGDFKAYLEELKKSKNTAQKNQAERLSTLIEKITDGDADSIWENKDKFQAIDLPKPLPDWVMDPSVSWAGKAKELASPKGGPKTDLYRDFKELCSLVVRELDGSELLTKKSWETWKNKKPISVKATEYQKALFSAVMGKLDLDCNGCLPDGLFNSLLEDPDILYIDWEHNPARLDRRLPESHFQALCGQPSMRRLSGQYFLRTKASSSPCLFANGFLFINKRICSPLRGSRDYNCAFALPVSAVGANKSVCYSSPLLTAPSRSRERRRREQIRLLFI